MVTSVVKASECMRLTDKLFFGFSFQDVGPMRECKQAVGGRQRV